MHRIRLFSSVKRNHNDFIKITQELLQGASDNITEQKNGNKKTEDFVSVLGVALDGSGAYP